METTESMIAAPPLTRTSSSSTLSCITVLGDSPPATPMDTPPTSVADASSVSSDAPKQMVPKYSARRAVRARRGLVTTYNENVLAGTAKRTSSADAGRRTVSGETLVEDVRTSDIMQDGIKALDLDWTIDAGAAEAGADSNNHAANASSSRRSTRLGRLMSTKDGLIGKASSLGKRGRDILEAGKSGVRDIAGRVQNTVRSMESKDLGTEPERKRAKLSGSPGAGTKATSKATSCPSPRRPRTQIRLHHGLYVGQDRDFDPRFTGTKNKQKAAARLSTGERQRTYLPLPMFTGQRLLSNGKDFKLPFEVFSPLPPGQPKPEEWRKTQKNVFVGEAASIWKYNKALEASRCICTPDTGCDDNCQNRYMFYECDNNNCNIGSEHCTNRSFADLRKRCKAGGKYNVGVEVIKTEDRGYGVRSNRGFEPHQIIVEYTGEIITQDECDDRMRQLYKANDCYYLMLFDQNMIIDATRGSIARFVNHSCEPNCKMVKWTVAGKPRMALFAGEKGIATGEELTYDYNFDPFSTKNVQECRCGSSRCRGVLGPKQKEQKSILSNLADQAKNAKRKIEDVIGGSVKGGSQAGKNQKLSGPKSTKKALMTGRTNAVDSAKKNFKITKRSLSSRTTSQSRQHRAKHITNFVKKHTTNQVKTKLAEKHVDGRKARSVQTASASMRRGVVRSIRGQRRASAVVKMGTLGGLNESGSTIRVIADKEVDT
ncbi:MAG: hypothetical protein M1833_006037 [Piccolia ochrophora]|nr:MAG: hypothetical protein M1833_006037 [Piccolia ochrophora]